MCRAHKKLDADGPIVAVNALHSKKGVRIMHDYSLSKDRVMVDKWS
jgi:hypothetical protein